MVKAFTLIEPPDTIHDIFVFGSNTKGIHGAGAAKVAAKKYGARRGVGMGLCGRSYAIPTRNEKLQTLPLNEIEPHIWQFIWFAAENTHLRFHVTQIGCGYAGYQIKDIAPLFVNALPYPNVILPPEFLVYFEANGYTMLR